AQVGKPTRGRYRPNMLATATVRPGPGGGNMTATQDDMIAELQRANTELRRERDLALAQKVALADVLDVINQSPGDPGLVLRMILEKAHSLCGAAVGSVMTYDGEYIHRVAMHGYPAAYEAVPRPPIRPSGGYEALIRGERLYQIEDVRTLTVPEGPEGEVPRAFRDLTGVRT